MRIINILEEGRFGGPQARVLAVADSLRNVGIETIVVFPRKNSEVFQRKLLAKGLKSRPLMLHRLTKHKLHLMKYFLFFLYEIFNLYRVIKYEHGDIVHCNGSWQIKGVLAGWLAGVKVVWHLNDAEMPFIIYHASRLIAKLFCHSFITSGDRVSNYYFKRPELASKRVCVIRPPVDTVLFDPAKVLEDPKMPNKTSNLNRLRIITVANVNPVKGLEYYVEIASLLNSRFANLEFIVVGSFLNSQKDYTRKLFNMVEQLKIANLIFWGPTDNVSSMLKSADIFVCTSVSESGPMSVWEAMAMALPIVSTDVGDVAKLIINGENGFVVPTRDVSALANKVSALINDKKLRSEFGRKARETAVTYLDIEICARQHAELYTEIMAAK